MARPNEIKIKWDKNPFKILKGLKTGIRNKYLRIAINKASSPVKAAVVAAAPQRLGILKKSMRIKVKNYRKGDVWASMIGPKAGLKKRKGKVKRGPNKGQPILHHPARYIRPLLKLHDDFLTPIMRSQGRQFASTVISSLKQQIENGLPRA